MGWLDEAACMGTVPTSAFYWTTPSERAVAACACCTVKGRCLTEELERRPALEEIDGYRAGLAAAERRAVLLGSVAVTSPPLRQVRLDRIRKAALSGVRVTEIAQAEGVTRRTIARWLRTDEAAASTVAG